MHKHGQICNSVLRHLIHVPSKRSRTPDTLPNRKTPASLRECLCKEGGKTQQGEAQNEKGQRGGTKPGAQKKVAVKPGNKIKES